MGTVRLRNINPLGRVDLPLIARQGDVEGPGEGCLEAGEEFDVDAALAGRAPSGTPGEDDYDPGEGLLAQVGNYEAVTAATRKPAGKAPKKRSAPRKRTAAAASPDPAGDAGEGDPNTAKAGE